MNELNLSESFNNTDKDAMNEMKSILSNFKNTLSPYKPFPKDLMLKEKDKFKTFLSTLKDLHHTRKEIYLFLLEDNLNELEESHTHIPITFEQLKQIFTQTAIGIEETFWQYGSDNEMFSQKELDIIDSLVTKEIYTKYLYVDLEKKCTDIETVTYFPDLDIYVKETYTEVLYKDTLKYTFEQVYPQTETITVFKTKSDSL